MLLGKENPDIKLPLPNKEKNMEVNPDRRAEMRSRSLLAVKPVPNVMPSINLDPVDTAMRSLQSHHERTKF